MFRTISATLQPLSTKIMSIGKKTKKVCRLTAVSLLYLRIMAACVCLENISPITLLNEESASLDLEAMMEFLVKFLTGIEYRKRITVHPFIKLLIRFLINLFRKKVKWGCRDLNPDPKLSSYGQVIALRLISPITGGSHTAGLYHPVVN